MFSLQYSDEDAEEALPNEVNLLSKRNELHGSHPEINPNEGGKEAYVIEGKDTRIVDSSIVILIRCCLRRS